MRKHFTIFLILVFVLGLVPINFSSAADLATRLKGKILLQVEDKGQAWYIEPKTGDIKIGCAYARVITNNVASDS